MTIVLSTQILAVRKRLSETAMKGRSLTVVEQREIASQLYYMEQLAKNQEQELDVFRLSEAGRLGRASVEQLATDAMGNLMLGTEKVVRPDFGRGKK